MKFRQLLVSRKPGRWINAGRAAGLDCIAVGKYKCSKCEAILERYDIKKDTSPWRFCPSCGSEMMT